MQRPSFHFSHVFTIGPPINFTIYYKMHGKGHNVSYNTHEGLKMSEHEKMFYILDGGEVVETDKEFNQQVFCNNINPKQIICKILSPKNTYQKHHLQDLISSALDKKFNYETGQYN